MREETWKPIAGYRGYDVSTHGRVRGPRGVLTSQVNWAGYSRVKLYRNQRPRKYAVSRLVLTAFVGPCPRKFEACHGDGNRSNNTLDNLRWDSRSSNHQDKRKHGTAWIGEKHKMARLTEMAVRVIRRLAGRMPHREIADIFHVHKSTVQAAISGRNWGHLLTEIE